MNQIPPTGGRSSYLSEGQHWKIQPDQKWSPNGLSNYAGPMATPTRTSAATFTEDLLSEGCVTPLRRWRPPSRRATGLGLLLTSFLPHKKRGVQRDQVGGKPGTWTLVGTEHMPFHHTVLGPSNSSIWRPPLPPHLYLSGNKGERSNKNTARVSRPPPFFLNKRFVKLRGGERDRVNLASSINVNKSTGAPELPNINILYIFT